MKYEILTLRLPTGATDALAAAGKPHGMDARAYGRWRLLRALAEDAPVTSAPFLVPAADREATAAPAAAPTGPRPVAPATPAAPSPAAATGPRPVTAADANGKPKNCNGPCSWVTPAAGDTHIGCELCSKRVSLLRLHKAHLVNMCKAKRAGDDGFRMALVAAVRAAREAAKRKPLDLGELD